jgi:hypothetical protein
MVSTLPEPKKETISSVRKKLIDLGFLENVEYDAINIEPVLIYSKSQSLTVFLRHKWETTSSILLKGELESEVPADDIAKYLVVDDDGNRWLKFGLPEQEGAFFLVLESFPI